MSEANVEETDHVKKFEKITSVTNNNIIRGLITLNTASNYIEGAYDNVTQKLTFFRIISFSNLLMNQIFTGYLMGAHDEIAGYFEVLPSAGRSVNRSIFGWYGTG